MRSKFPATSAVSSSAASTLSATARSPWATLSRLTTSFSISLAWNSPRLRCSAAARSVARAACLICGEVGDDLEGADDRPLRSRIGTPV